MVGTVTAFDERRGVGSIAADGRDHFFNRTRIADGTRTVRVGETVEFRIVPGRRGDWEATDIHKRDPEVVQ